MGAEEFMDKMKVWWASYMFQGTPNYMLAKKLTSLKLDLKKWNETEFGNVTLKKQQLWSKLNALDARRETHALGFHLREEGSNTIFFLHKMANSNRCNNGIESLLVNGSLSSDQGMIENCITQFFMNLYSE